MSRKRKTQQPPPPQSLETTGTLLIRAAASMERFDAQLEQSKEIASAVRRELDAKDRRRPRGG